MTLTQKIILIALLLLGGICLIVGFTLMHYIGGFLNTMEEEKERDDEAARQTDAGVNQQDKDASNTKT